MALGRLGHAAPARGRRQVESDLVRRTAPKPPLRHSHKSNSRYCSSSSAGPLSSPSARSGRRKIQALGKEIQAWGKENPSQGKNNPRSFLPRIEPFQRVAPAPAPGHFATPRAEAGPTPRPFPTSKTRGRNSKSVGRKSKPAATKSKSGGIEIQIRRNEIQISLPSTNLAFSRVYRRI